MDSSGVSHNREDLGSFLENHIETFNDTSGSDIYALLRNKLDIVETTLADKERGCMFLNGGWSGQNYGFAIGSKINYVIQVIMIFNTDIWAARKINGAYTYTRYFNTAQDDSGWRQFTLNSGFTNAWGSFNSSYRKSGNVVNVMMAVKFTSVPAWGTTIATLPEGFRPVTEFDLFCRAASNNNVPVLIAISSNGNINYLQATSSISANNTLVISATFITA